MNTYRTVIYGDWKDDDRMITEQEAVYYSKPMMQRTLDRLMSLIMSTDKELHFLTYCNGEPVLYGHLDVWEDALTPSTLQARFWVARWGQQAGEYERRFIFAE